MDSALIRTIEQMALHRSPISRAELRETCLRHLLSAGYCAESSGIAVSRRLIEAYCTMVKRDIPDWATTSTGKPWPILQPGAPEHDEIDVYYAGYYLAGFGEGLKQWLETPVGKTPAAARDIPDILPVDLTYYPHDLISQFATARGYLDGRGDSPSTD